MARTRSYVYVLAALLLFALPPVFATTINQPAAYPAYKPYAYIYGTTTNTILNGYTPMNYNPSVGIQKTLPYNFSSGNLVFPFANVAFTKNLLNNSVKGTTAASPSGKLTVSSVQALSANGVNYLALQAANASALAASTSYVADVTDVLNPTVSISSTSYVTVTAEINSVSASTISAPSISAFADYRPFIILKVVDTGGATHNVEISLSNTFSTGTTSDYTPTAPADSMVVNYATGASTNTAIGKAYTVQANLGHMLSLVSYTWVPSVVSAITYGVQADTGTTLIKTSTISAQFINAFSTAAPVQINGATLFNGTTTKQTYSLALAPATKPSVLTISNAAWTQVAGVTFPFLYAPAPTPTLYPAQLQIQYSWNFSQLLATVPGLSFSNVNLNMSMNSLTPGMFTTLFLNGGSYSAAISTFTGTQTGTVLTSLTSGVKYYMQALITYNEAQYDGVTQIPGAFQNPASWIEANFWAVVTAIAGVFGLGVGAWATRARELRVPK